jgi:hypothetical protein
MQSLKDMNLQGFLLSIIEQQSPRMLPLGEEEADCINKLRTNEHQSSAGYIVNRN